ncbi:MAG: FMN-linked oxidoreductase [Aureobasidium pullulans]|nr:MAG: FMN-linked oxidoreductase [Aureobasidium pullulans]
MASTGIEGFTNVYDIMEASAAGDKLRLRRAARKIRLVLMCADNATLDDEHRTALTAILGLLVPSWEEAEKLRLEAAQSYLHVRGKAALCCKNAEARVDDKIRHHILDELTGKQKRSAPPSGLRTLQIQNERQARENLKELGLGYRYAIVKMYPERAFDHPDLKHVLEMRAMELASLMYNGFVEVGGCHQLDFLFDGYFEALARHHDMESLEDFDPDIDAMPPSARPSKPAKAERKKTKNKKRNQRKRAAEKIKAKDAVATISELDDSEPKAELETSMALVKISPSSAASVECPRVKFIPQPKDKVWMDHGCIKSEACTKYFEILREAMLKVPIGNLERRVYGPQP